MQHIDKRRAHHTWQMFGHFVEREFGDFGRYFFMHQHRTMYRFDRRALRIDFFDAQTLLDAHAKFIKRLHRRRKRYIPIIARRQKPILIIRTNLFHNRPARLGAQ